MSIRKFKRILVANRSEIAIRIFRACRELGIRSVAIYSEEDSKSLFRTRADEAYLIGKGKKPVDAYLDIEEIVSLALSKGVDAIHPGYGFLSENPDLARACERAGIVFIGPDISVLEDLGDKVSSKIVARKAGVPTIPGLEKPVQTVEEALKGAEYCGYPVMVKASAGGGGRGMRIVYSPEELPQAFASAQSESQKAFASSDMFIEKYLEKPKHIEVQILGDKHGNLVHLYERDCSIQRRHQKVIEMSPAFALPEDLRDRICEDAVKIAKSVNYSNAGTVEFLVDKHLNHYFIEVNPRIQVEHTVTEETCGIDLVQSQILVAQGYRLDSKAIGIPSQESIHLSGYAIQCRVTTEDPLNGFAPDHGVIDIYRSGSGFGIRLDAGNAYAGAEISPYYDSLLVKVTTHARTFADTIRKANRALREMRVTGVKTNIGFLLNVLNSKEFREGTCDTGFIEAHPELFDITPKKNIDQKVLNHIAEIVVNDHSRISSGFDVPVIPKLEEPVQLRGTKQIFDEKGADGLVSWVKDQKRLLLTDTTMRDAQQSLMATRVRTRDMTRIARQAAIGTPGLFSMEMWGGATFDVAYRFLREDPWERLAKIRDQVPNILMQMLLRGNNTVGYTNYPDNVVKKFIKEAAKAGIDVFRIFDSLNWIEGVRQPIELVRQENKIAEAAICYTGDILDEYKDKYTLDYYVKKAKELEKAGAQIIAIKDMSGLLKPYAAKKLVRALKDAVDAPIHLHTHDTTGNGVATVIMAAEAGVDIADTAINAMSGLTSQPSLNSVVAALENTDRDTHIDLKQTDAISNYWEAVRPVYGNYESGLKSGSTEIYRYEIPGGQYSNLKPQVESFGLGHRFQEVKETYRAVNLMLGDIVKVTPSSKMVGDLAIFMVQNDLDEKTLLEKGDQYDYPDSVISYFKGMMGQPDGGFPEELRKIVLKGEKYITGRPGEYLPDFDFEAAEIHLKNDLGMKEVTDQDLAAYALYPKVFDGYINALKEKGDLSNMGSDIFFHGLNVGETCEIEIEPGKTLIITLIEIGNLNDDGTRTVDFEINGNRRAIAIKDRSEKPKGLIENPVLTVNPDDPAHVGSSIPGTVVKVAFKKDDKVKKGDVLMVIEAMKMETNIICPHDGMVTNVYVKEGDLVESNQLIMMVE